ncbi:hypothetical protein [Ammoniphilus sp. 3BR4]|uniref:hypothetical protein n=1 Tax=Ammoniphilus sp. 3BR4 TaxID=3158265 RepID=UPI003467C684
MILQVNSNVHEMSQAIQYSADISRGKQDLANSGQSLVEELESQIGSIYRSTYSALPLSSSIFALSNT